MKLFVTATSIGLTIGYMLAGTSPGHAASNVIDGANSCQRATNCARQAENEREKKRNPGMGEKFNSIKQDCTALARQCSRDMAAPEPKRIPKRNYD